MNKLQKKDFEILKGLGMSELKKTSGGGSSYAKTLRQKVSEISKGVSNG